MDCLFTILAKIVHNVHIFTITKGHRNDNVRYVAYRNLVNPTSRKQSSERGIKRVARTADGQVRKGRGGWNLKDLKTVKAYVFLIMQGKTKILTINATV